MRKFRQIAAVALGTISLTVATTAKASVACSFYFNNVAIDWAGNVNITATTSGTSYTWYVCNIQGSISVTSSSGTINLTSGNCSALFSQMLTARSSGQPMVFSFGNLSACTSAQLPASGTWMSPNFPNNFAY